MVTDIHWWPLNDGTPASIEEKALEEEASRERLTKLCKTCSTVIPPKARACPGCGEPQGKVNDVEVVQGELVDLEAVMAKRVQRKLNREITWEEKRIWMGSLKAHALLTGKKAGWVAHMYKDRFGVWPDDARVKYEPAHRYVLPEIVNWIRSRNIAWAKSQQKAGR
jgi:hypothetical protein